MNKELRIKLLKQACEDIKENAEDIVGNTKYDTTLSVEIRFDDNEFPTIVVNKEFPVSFTDEIEDYIYKNEGVD